MQVFRGRTRFFLLCAMLATSGLAKSGWAQGTEPTPPANNEPEPTPPGQEPTPPGQEPTPPGQEPKQTQTAPQAEPDKKGPLGSISWRDIVTVPRRPILKYHRIELVPTYNVSINSNLIRHHGFGGIINFFLSETLSVGVEGAYTQNQNLDHYFQRGLQDRVLPSLNRYRWNASLVFNYVPIYGKFALFNRWIVQWETYIGAGVGATQTEWIPRDPANAAATNYTAMWHLDVGARFFFTKWLVFHVYLKDYMFIDKYEPTVPRESTALPDRKTWVDQFTQNVVFGVGVGMFLPTNFEYKYLR